MRSSNSVILAGLEKGVALGGNIVAVTFLASHYRKSI
jgi:hypothetical protein